MAICDRELHLIRTFGEVVCFLFIYLFSERVGREKEREQNMGVGENPPVASLMPPNGDLARNSSMCPNGESNQQLNI